MIIGADEESILSTSLQEPLLKRALGDTIPQLIQNMPFDHAPGLGISVASCMITKEFEDIPIWIRTPQTLAILDGLAE